MLAVRVSLLSLLVFALWGQTFRGNLSGTVTDSSGAALASAAVSLSNPKTGLNQATVTSGEGMFLFPELPAGTYQLTIRHPGFEVKKVENVEVAVSKTTDLRVQLGLAQQSAVVEVSASGVNVDTTTSSLVAVVNSKAVQDLPMNGRDFRQMMKLSPGVTPNGGTSVNGMRTNGNNYQIDGADNNDAWSNNVAVNQGGVSGIAGALVPIEAIDQFSVQTNAEADMGRNGGSNINMVLKSGTNNLHGDLFYFNRNEALASLGPTQAAGSPKQVIRNNQFGFTVGGPVIKNRTFFFLTGEIQLAIANNSILDTAPSTAWVTQATGVLAKYGLTPNPVSLNLLSLYPADSKGGPASANNYLSNGRNTYNSYNGIAKVDHRFTDKHTISARYLGGTGTQVADVGSHFRDYFQQAPMHVHNFSVVENSILSPRLVNQVTLGVNYFLQTFNDFNTSFNVAALGLNTGVPGNLTGAPTIRISGFDYVGATPPLGRTDVTGHVTDNLSYAIGRHQLKIGGEYRRANLDVAYFTNGRGSFMFDGTRGPWSSDKSVSSTLKALSDFLAGTPTNSNGAVIVRGNPERVYLVNSGDAWAHDDFQTSPKLSLNFGVRYTYQGVVHDAKNSLANFTPGQGFSTGQLYNPDRKDFAPRFGFAYTPSANANTVVRGGYGIYYDVPTVGSFVYNSISNGAASGIYANPAGPIPVFTTVAQGVTFGSGVPVFGTAGSNPPYGVYSVNRNFRTPYAQNFNLNVQRKLTSSTLAQAGYVGSLGRRLGAVLDINQLTGGVRPYAAQYPTLGAINQVNSMANSNYNSLQASVRQTFWHGFSANANYTWSRANDDVSSVTTPSNSRNLRADYGPSTFDTRHIFTGFLSYEVPQWAPVLPRVTKGWQVNSLLTFTTGSPVNLLAGTDVSGTKENKDRVDLVGDPFAGTPYRLSSLAEQYLNPAAFAKPAPGTFGNLGRDAIYGPGFGSVDFSVFKKTPITERIGTELRVEVLNLFNRANWANPTASLTSASFGQLTQTRNGASAPGLGFGEPRNVQLALKVTF